MSKRLLAQQLFTAEQIARLSAYRDALAAGLVRAEFTDDPTYNLFTSAEVFRLGVYRAAIRAGFFNDDDHSQ